MPELLLHQRQGGTILNHQRRSRVAKVVDADRLTKPRAVSGYKETTGKLIFSTRGYQVAGVYLFLPDHAPEVHDEMSATMPRPIQTQSNPVTPPRATAAHINVVHGANRNPANAQKKLLNAASQREVSISHQTRMAALGPTKASVANKQHIQLPPD